jgi:hypothetical protein
VLNLGPLKVGLQESGIEQAEVKRSKWIAWERGCLPSSHAPIASSKLQSGFCSTFKMLGPCLKPVVNKFTLLALQDQ